MVPMENVVQLSNVGVTLPVDELKDADEKRWAALTRASSIPDGFLPTILSE